MAAEAAAGTRAEARGGAAWSEPARAKVNLHLHVRGRRPDGLHLLDSLVVFPDIADLLEAEPARALSLSLDGPFGAGLSAGADNLVIAAAEALAARAAREGAQPAGAALRLVKRLPVASGIGGGSADAAAALRLLNRMWGLDYPRSVLAEVGLGLGADIPVCVHAPRALVMSGIGEVLTPAPALPRFWLVLANPGVATPTGAVFGRLAHRDGRAAAWAAEGYADAAALAAALSGTSNMLEAPAREVTPQVGATLDALAAAPGVLLARMSGSGATCFGLFAQEEPALAAAQALREAGMWAEAGAVAPTPAPASASAPAPTLAPAPIR